MKKIAIIGLPTDTNASFLKGPAKAPDRIKHIFKTGSLNMASEVGHEFVKHESIYWHADIEEDTFETFNKAISDNLADLDKADALPIFVGGDHSVSYPILKTIAEKSAPLTILHFDAHPDLYHEFKGNKHSNACPFARIMENKLAKRLVQVGIRTMNSHQRKQAEKFGVEVIEMKNFSDAAEISIDGPVYISFDIDALDPAFAPGVSHIEPGGLSVRDALNIIQSIDCEIVAADIVEYNPDRDINDMTAYICVKLIKEIGGVMVSNNCL